MLIAVSVKIGRISVRSSFVSMGQFQLFVSIPVLFVFVALPIGYHKARVGSSTYHFSKTSSQSVLLLSWCLSALHFFCCFSVALWVCVVFSFFSPAFALRYSLLSMQSIRRPGRTLF